MLSPEKKWPGSTVTIQNTFTDADGFAVDPDEVSLRLLGPYGTETTYAYPGGGISKISAGVYSCDVVPDAGGVWFFRWQTVTDDYSLTPEGDFVVQVSPFMEGRPDVYRA